MPQRWTVGFLPVLVDEQDPDDIGPERLSLESTAYDGREVDPALGSDPIPSMTYDYPDD